MKPAQDSVAAEKMVLGRLLHDNAARHSITLRADDFHGDTHRTAFHEIVSMIDAGKSCDLVTLSETLRDNGTLEQVGGVAYLGQLAADHGWSRQIESHAGIVREYADRRRLRQACTEIANEGLDAADMAKRMADVLDSINSRDIGAVDTIHDLIQSALAAARERKALRDAGSDIGATTGLPTVDDALGAFAPGCFYIVAARPGVGKTAFLQQVAIHAAKRGFPGFIASLEMNRNQLGSRAIAHITETNVSELMRGYDRAISAASTRLLVKPTANVPLYIDTTTVDLGGIVARLFEMKRKHGIKLAAVDHIGLVQGVRANSRNDVLGEITWTLKRTAKRLDIAIIGLSQLSRASEKEHRRPMLADLRDSGNIEQDADLVIFLHDPKEKESVVGTLPRRDIGLFKNRDGREGWLPAEFRFDGRSQTFSEINRQYEDSSAGGRPASRSIHAAAGE